MGLNSLRKKAKDKQELNQASESAAVASCLLIIPDNGRPDKGDEPLPEGTQILTHFLGESRSETIATPVDSSEDVLKVLSSEDLTLTPGTLIKNPASRRKPVGTQEASQ